MSSFLDHAGRDESAMRSFIEKHGFHFWTGRYQHVQKCTGKGAEKGPPVPLEMKIPKNNKQPGLQLTRMAHGGGAPGVKRGAPKDAKVDAKRQAVLPPVPPFQAIKEEKVHPADSSGSGSGSSGVKAAFAAIPGAWASGFYE